ncbi:hypothetical protein DPMN_122656 [Dreissena polymorpha]|uniref:Uncharacterized protein n=1 Tax=Dreissena polymorpha TaxID=45954 RepID=A0A9D4GVY4_DREPO|nr:hypothetical protein DPMN_122656 [Dreissena polymorpha]
MEAAMMKLALIRVHFARVLVADKASSDEQFWGRFNEKLQHPTVVARLCGRPTLVGRQLTTRRVQGASCRDCGRTTVWSVILHGF